MVAEDAQVGVPFGDLTQLSLVVGRQCDAGDQAELFSRREEIDSVGRIEPAAIVLARHVMGKCLHGPTLGCLFEPFRSARRVVGVRPHRIDIGELFQTLRVPLQCCGNIVVVFGVVKDLGADDRRSIYAVYVHLVDELFD